MEIGQLIQIILAIIVSVLIILTFVFEFMQVEKDGMNPIIWLFKQIFISLLKLLRKAASLFAQYEWVFLIFLIIVFVIFVTIGYNNGYQGNPFQVFGKMVQLSWFIIKDIFNKNVP